jgi:DNA-binding ferritin-like protein (Dps family)
MVDDFEQSIAHVARDRTRITLRWIRDRLYLKGRSFARSIRDGAKEVSTVACFPVMHDLDETARLFNRLNWYMGATSVRALLPTPHDRPAVLDRVQTLSHQPAYADDGAVALVGLEAVDEALTVADYILVWNWKALLLPKILSRLHQTALVDPGFYSARESMEWYKEVCGALQEESSHQKNQERFRKLYEQAADYQEAYVFATGPSLDSVFEHDIPNDALRIICNSIVRNGDLLDHLDPDVLTFADPVFHFGPSTYAAKFRNDAIETLRTYDCWCIVNTPGDALLRARFPDVADHIIGIPERGSLSRFHTPTSSELFVRTTGNIMTLFMLPLAAALADRIRIVGADGREENESYFWKHSSIAQYEGLMNSAVEEHPSFFRDRMYEDYYDRHINLLREQIETHEAQGKVYHSITPSHIPVLKQRQAPADVKPESN